MKSQNTKNPFFVALVIFSIGLLILISLPYLGAIALAVALTILFQPIYQSLKTLMPQGREVIAALTVILAVFVILLPIIFLGFSIIQEAQGLYLHLTAGNTNALIDFLNEQLHKITPRVSIDLNQYPKQILEGFLGNLGLIFSGITNLSITILLAIFTFYYLLKDGHRMREVILRISPFSSKNTLRIIDRLIAMASSVIRGTLVIATIQGLIVGTGFFFFGLPNPILWGSVSVMAALVPVIGVPLVILAGMAFLAITGNFFALAGLALFCFPLTALSDNLLRPRLIGQETRIHPLLILFSVLGGLTVFGPTGLLLGPLALSFFLTLIEVHPSIS